MAITQTITVKLDTHWLTSFAELLEKHAAAIRADLEEFMAAQAQDEGTEGGADVMADGKVTRAELAEAVRELREEVARLRAERTAHACHGHSLCCSHVHCNWGHCGCFTVHGYGSTWTYPSTFTVSSGGNVSGLGGGASGCNPNPVLGYQMEGGTVVSSGYTVSASN